MCCCENDESILTVCLAVVIVNCLIELLWLILIWVFLIPIQVYWTGLDTLIWATLLGDVLVWKKLDVFFNCFQLLWLIKLIWMILIWVCMIPNQVLYLGVGFACCICKNSMLRSRLLNWDWYFHLTHYKNDKEFFFFLLFNFCGYYLFDYFD